MSPSVIVREALGKQWLKQQRDDALWALVLCLQCCVQEDESTILVSPRATALGDSTAPENESS